MTAIFRRRDLSTPISRAALLLLVPLGLWAVAVRPARADDAQSRQAPVSDEVAAAKDWYEAAKVAWEAGVIRFSELQEASLAWKQAALDVATSKPARIKALQAHLDRLLALKRAVDGLKWGMLGPANGEEWMYNFWVAEAKVWVAEERARQ